MNKYFSAVSGEEASARLRQENLREQERRDASLDEALGLTFPASDRSRITSSDVPSYSHRVLSFFPAISRVADFHFRAKG